MTKQYGLNPTTVSLFITKPESFFKLVNIQKYWKGLDYFCLKSGCLYDDFGFLTPLKIKIAAPLTKK